MLIKTHKHRKTLAFILFSPFLAISVCSGVEPTTNVKTLNNLKYSPENKYNISYKSELFAYSAKNSNQNSCSVTTVSKKIMQLANESRSQKQKCDGKRYRVARKLAHSCELQNMAQEQAEHLYEVGKLSHTSAQGESLSERADRFSVPWLSIGENVASGYRSPAEAHEGWMKSGAHCENIMNPDYDQFGAAEHKGSWVVVFIKKR